MLQQQQRKDEVLAFEMKEPCTPLGQKNYNNFFVYSNTIDNILHGENEVIMW